METKIEKISELSKLLSVKSKSAVVLGRNSLNDGSITAWVMVLFGVPSMPAQARVDDSLCFSSIPHLVPGRVAFCVS